MHRKALRTTIALVFTLAIAVPVASAAAGASAVTAVAPVHTGKPIATQPASVQFDGSGSPRDVKPQPPGTFHPQVPSHGAPKIANPDADLHQKPEVPRTVTPRQASGSIIPAASTTEGTHFPGLVQTTQTPFDLSAAASNSGDLVETVNSDFAGYNKSNGVQLYDNSLFSWYNIPTGGKIFDPHVTYDPIGNEYVMVASDGTNFRVSVSVQGNASGLWCRYTLNATTVAGQFADYPQIGVDQRYIYLTMVDYSSETASSPSDNVFVALSRTDAESCKTKPAGRSAHTLRDPGTGCLLCQNNLSFRVAPATDFDSTYTGGWLADSYGGGGSHITVWNFNSSDTLVPTQVSTPSYSVATSAQQPGTPTSYLDTGNTTFTNITKLGGTLYLALTSGYDWGNGNKNAVVNWMQVSVPSVNGINVAKSGSFGAAGLWFFDPSTSGPATAGQYQVFNFAIAGASQAPAGATATYTNSGDSYSPYTVTLAGGTNYGDATWQLDTSDCSASPCYRWGDFTSLMNDPTNLSSMWATQGAAPTADAWVTQLTQLTSG